MKSIYSALLAQPEYNVKQTGHGQTLEKTDRFLSDLEELKREYDIQIAEHNRHPGTASLEVQRTLYKKAIITFFRSIYSGRAHGTFQNVEEGTLGHTMDVGLRALNSNLGKIIRWQKAGAKGTLPFNDEERNLFARALHSEGLPVPDFDDYDSSISRHLFFRRVAILGIVAGSIALVTGLIAEYRLNTEPTSHGLGTVAVLSAFFAGLASITSFGRLGSSIAAKDGVEKLQPPLQEMVVILADMLKTHSDTDQ